MYPLGIRRGSNQPPYRKGPYTWGNKGLTHEDRLTVAPYRYTLHEHFCKLPQLTGTIDGTYDTETVRNCNMDFELKGTNSSDGDVTFASTIGGLQIETDTGSADQEIILPHLDSEQSAWTGIPWGTENQVIWEATIRTSAITDTLIWLGLKETEASAIATDDDKAWFRYSAAADTNWQALYSIGGTDTAIDTGIAVVADTNVYFRIEIDEDRIARYYINDEHVGTSTALTNDKDLIPYIGVQTETTAAKKIYVASEHISRIIFE